MKKEETKKVIEIEDESLEKVVGGTKPLTRVCPLCGSRNINHISTTEYRCSDCGFWKESKNSGFWKESKN